MDRCATAGAIDGARWRSVLSARHRSSFHPLGSVLSPREGAPLSFAKESSMSRKIESMSDADLLGVLVGRRVASQLLKQVNGSLSQLLHEPLPAEYAQPRVASKLKAAKELVRRAFAESMQLRDVLSSPAAVRDFLRVTLARRDHEVFMALFLDARTVSSLRRNCSAEPEPDQRVSARSHQAHPRTQRSRSDLCAQPSVRRRRAQSGGRDADPFTARCIGLARCPCPRPLHRRRQWGGFVLGARFAVAIRDGAGRESSLPPLE